MNVEMQIQTIAASIEKRRKSLGLTQAELAALAGVSARFVYDLENGKKTISMDKFLAVAKVLGYNLNLKIAVNE